jgi:CPA2 family monovalent cation:H+ antiporter-2
MIGGGLRQSTFHYLKLPVVLGYILAGVSLGHSACRRRCDDQQNNHTLAGLGVVFLCLLGLEFQFPKIRRSASPRLSLRRLENGFMFFAGYQIASCLDGNR